MIGTTPKIKNSGGEQAESGSREEATDLDVTQFSDLLASLQNTRPSNHDDDQRSQPRAELLARATIIPLRECAHPGDLAILIRNLSPAGLGFLYEHKMSLGEEFALLLPCAGDTPSVVLCAVASWQPLARDLFAIGAQFTRILRHGGEKPLPIVPTAFVPPTANAFQHRRVG